MNTARSTALAICMAFGAGALGSASPVSAQTSDEVMGTLLGGAIGGALGATIGSGDGRDAATGIGALLGAMEGYERTKARNEAQRRRAGAYRPRSETQVPHASPFLLRPEGSNATLQCELVEHGMLCRPGGSPRAERVY